MSDREDIWKRLTVGALKNAGQHAVLYEPGTWLSWKIQRGAGDVIRFEKFPMWFELPWDVWADRRLPLPILVELS